MVALNTSTYGLRWTVTNSVEQHLRLRGKIVGKIRKCEGGWQCQIHTPRLRWIGFRKKDYAAREIVERDVVRRMANKTT